MSEPHVRTACQVASMAGDKWTGNSMSGRRTDSALGRNMDSSMSGASVEAWQVKYLESSGSMTSMAGEIWAAHQAGQHVRRTHR